MTDAYNRDASFMEIMKWIWQGKSVARSFMNVWLAHHGNSVITGNVYDLGGAGRPSFMDVVDLPASYSTVDMLAEAKPTIVANIEETLPIADGVADTVLLFNTLEHVYGFQHVASEMHRITKPGGRALVYVPFLVGFHTHQGKDFFINDFFRYTQSSLQRIFHDAGFGKVTIIPRGGLGWAMAELAMVAVRIWPARVLMGLIFGGLEHLTRRLRRFDSAAKYPLGYFVLADKAA